MHDRWRVCEVDEASLTPILPHADGDPLAARLMWLRGIQTAEQARQYFQARTRNLASPFLLGGMHRAIDRILTAVEREESIRVYGDRDVDGITSTVLLLETLRQMTPRVDFCVPLIEDGYGLNPEQLQAARRDGVKLLVTVDCGISNVAEVALARELGIEIIVTDHHEPPTVLPEAVAIVNPKMPGGPGPTEPLAGVGVSLKVSLALALARSPRLVEPLIVVDLSDAELDIRQFCPRRGFAPVKLTPPLIENGHIVFFNAKEDAEIRELLPDLANARKVTYVAPLVVDLDPSLPADKAELAVEFAIPSSIHGAERLAHLYLKIIEAGDAGVKQLWQRALDVLTLGTIADMVPLRAENRTLAKLGLPFIGRTKRLGLLELFARLGWNQRPITEKEVSWNIAPILNASGRLKTAELAIDLLTTDHPPLAESLSRELYDLNQERKRLVGVCYEQIHPQVLAQCDPARDRLLLVHAPIPNQGVTGIVATRLVQEFTRPVIVLVQDDNHLLGSARSFNDINLVEVLHACEDLLIKYGGHINAAGLTLLPENLPRLRERLRTVTEKLIPWEMLTDVRRLDAELTPEQINDHLLEMLGRFAPFGIANPAPMFIVRNMLLAELRRVGDRGAHLRFRFKRPDGAFIAGIGFNLGDRLPPGEPLPPAADVVFSVEANVFNGNRHLQMVVHDLSFAQPQLPPLEAQQ